MSSFMFSGILEYSLPFIYSTFLRQTDLPKSQISNFNQLKNVEFKSLARYNIPERLQNQKVLPDFKFPKPDPIQYKYH